jgi:hypothetical protein
VLKWPAETSECEDMTALITDRLAVPAASSNLTCARLATERDATATDEHSKLLTNVFVASVLRWHATVSQMPVRAFPYTSITPNTHTKAVVTSLEGIHFVKR